MSGRGLFVRFAARAFRGLLSICVFGYFPFGFEGRIWDPIVSVSDHCSSFYFVTAFTVVKSTFYRIVSLKQSIPKH